MVGQLVCLKYSNEGRNKLTLPDVAKHKFQSPHNVLIHIHAVSLNYRDIPILPRKKSGLHFCRRQEWRGREGLPSTVFLIPQSVVRFSDFTMTIYQTQSFHRAGVWIGDRYIFDRRKCQCLNQGLSYWQAVVSLCDHAISVPRCQAGATYSSIIYSYK